MKRAITNVPEIIRRSSVGLALAPCPVPGAPQAAALRPRRAAFTLIELLVAMAILLIIVAIVAQIFQQANVAWETGMRNVEITMKGRALADIIAQDLSQAIPSNGGYSVTAGGADFYMLGRADATNNYSALWPVAYDWSGPTVTRDAIPIAEGVDKVEVTPAGVTVPEFVTVTVTVSNHVFQAKAFMHNRERYAY